MKRKRRGFEEFFAAPVILLFLFAVVFYFVNLTADMDKSRQLNLVLRRYTMLMETKGCLTVSDRDQLVLELEELGAGNIRFNGNPVEKVGYGDAVVLSISGELEAGSIVGYKDFAYVREGSSLAFEKTLQSTAQY